MGYKPKRTLYRLRFADPDMDGLIVTTRSISTGQMLELQKYGSQIAGAEDGDVPREMIDKMIDLLVAGIIDWNVEDDNDQPIPPTKDALLDQELPFLFAIIQAWGQAVTGVSESLGKDSTSGETFPEESIPMEILSSSLAS